MHTMLDKVNSLLGLPVRRYKIYESEESDAREFFGLSPSGDYDIFTLRSRKFNMDRRASSGEKDEIARNYNILTKPKSNEPSISTSSTISNRTTSEDHSTNMLIADIDENIDTLLNAEVVQATIVVMRNLSNNLRRLLSLVGKGISTINRRQRDEIIGILMPLTSESIREALHRGELSITNGIIRSKNQILTAFGVPTPQDHHEINAADFGDYNW